MRPLDPAARANERAQHARILATAALGHPPITRPAPPETATRSAARKQTWRELIIAELAHRDGDHCYLCRQQLDLTTPHHVHIDHVIPETLGGDHLLYNLALACPDCNTRKAALIVAFYVTSELPWYALHAATDSPCGT